MTDQDNGKAGAITPTFLSSQTEGLTPTFVTDRVPLEAALCVNRITLREMLGEAWEDELDLVEAHQQNPES